MAIHVVGHLRETVTSTAREIAVEPAPPVPGRGARAALIAVTIAIGVGSGIAALDWAAVWRR
jgi:hypothetical protein